MVKGFVRKVKGIVKNNKTKEITYFISERGG